MAVDLGRALRSVRLWQWGALIAIVGAVVVIVGAVQTTSGKLPDYCDEGTLVAKFNFDNGEYVFEKPSGNENVVTITAGTATGGQWSSTVEIASIIVKGGPGAFRIDYVPPATSGTFFNDALPPVGNGNIPDISNLQFCGSGTPTTTTTAPPGTTTTTAPPETTTTSAPPGTTTTTASPETTTTSAPPATTTTTTTTTPPATTTTTTSPATTTSRPGTTTTTRPGTTTTTVSATTTTTGAGVTTTSSPVGSTTTTQVGGVSVTRIEPVGESSSGDNLPQTGAPSVPLIVLGAVLVAIGLGLVILSRFRDRNLRT